MTRDVTSAAFAFRLERVRALRERAEDSAREELASSLAHRVRGEALLREAADRVLEARSGQRAQGPTTGDDLLANQAWLERAERARTAAELELDRANAEVDARRAALTDAARERQALERLKERRRADHVARVARAEAEHLDELALSQHRRRSLA